MNTYDLITQNFDELYHHGIKGQKWGIRRFQNPDGSLTAEGKRRYGTVENFNRLSAAESKMQKAKTAKQNANANYNREYNKARSVKNSVYGLIGDKEHRAAVTKQWEKTIDYAQKAGKADKDYKTAKKEYKNLKKSVSKLAKVKAKDLSKAQVKKGEQFVKGSKKKKITLRDRLVAMDPDYKPIDRKLAETVLNDYQKLTKGEFSKKYGVTEGSVDGTASIVRERIRQDNRIKQAKKEYRKSK